MSKPKAKAPDDHPLLMFKTEKQKKYFLLTLLDFILLCVIFIIVPNLLLMVILSAALFGLLLTHLKAYHLAIKEGGGIS